MSNELKSDGTFWDKLGDGLSAFSEGVNRFLTSLFGSRNERYVKDIGYIRPLKGQTTHTVRPGSILAAVNALEDTMKALSEEELRGTATRLREKLAAGATLDDILPEAFAATREAARRTKGMRHFDVQIVGGVILHRGNIAEMITGEGKTLVATLPAALNALEGKGVCVVTVNDYLARRDCEWMLPIYRALGLTAGYIQSDMDPTLRRKAYDCDITYGTNSEFGFDYLRDNMKMAARGDEAYEAYSQQVQRVPLNYAIIDEVDNILIDEARTPLIIAGPAFTDVRRYDRANQVAVQLTELQKSNPGKYFEIKEKEHTCHLTDEGVHKAEQLAGVESFYTAGNMEWPHLIDNALKAHHLYKRDKRYAVIRNEENELAIVIIDEFTGRLMMGRQWSDGLHQAVEAKHSKDGVKIKEETQTLATVTLQNFFKMFKKLAGMTGTAMTEADEFMKIYKLEVLAVPTNRALVRKDAPDSIYRTEREKWDAVVNEVIEIHKSGRPLLIGTTDVDKSLKLSELLKRRGVKHELLNALPEHAAREADIVAQAGRIGAVTISTNMAGRGTDIILGGNPETMAWSQLRHKYASRLDVPENEWKAVVDAIETKEKTKEEGRKVAAMGGLAIIGTERHEARRIDNQLRGRAGRQGDPGSSRFYLSLQDDLMRIFAGEWVGALLQRLGMEEGQAIESGMVSRRISAAQKKVEERNFDSRKSLLEYDEVMDHQRKEIYGYRQRILDGTNCKILIVGMFQRAMAQAVKKFLSSDHGASSFARFASTRLGVSFKGSDFGRASYDEAVHLALERAQRNIEPFVHEAIEENLGSEDKSEWNWQALTNQMNARYGLKLVDRDLKKLVPTTKGNESPDTEKLYDLLVGEASKSVETVDLSEGMSFLESDFGLNALIEWVDLKFQFEITLEEIKGKSEAKVTEMLMAKITEMYRQKEIEFPVHAGMAQFMNDQGPVIPGQQKYNRDGLFGWAHVRFPKARHLLNEETFRTSSRAKIQEMLMEISKANFPTISHSDIDAKWRATFEGSTRPCDAEDAKDLSAWMREKLDLEIAASELEGRTPDVVRSILWTEYDLTHRPEMRQVERGLVLGQLDSAWKNHLYTMDHLRSGISLRSYGQEDPKTVYKQEGMKEFGLLWGIVEEKVTEMVFRMEDSDDVGDTIWAIRTTRKEAAPTLQSQAVAAEQAQAQAQKMAPRQEQVQTNSGEAKKTEPIRNRGEKIGRNDPCPCGSGKKYKNCHMRATA
jgi:preprotein translocase subunit SecA